MEDSRQGGLREQSIPQNTTNGLKAQFRVGVLSAKFPSLGKLYADLTFLTEPYNISLGDET